LPVFFEFAKSGQGEKNGFLAVQADKKAMVDVIAISSVMPMEHVLRQC
jgi:hypothetical protein